MSWVLCLTFIVKPREERQDGSKDSLQAYAFKEVGPSLWSQDLLPHMLRMTSRLLETEYIMHCGQYTYPIDVSISVDHMSLGAVNQGLGKCWIGAFHEDQVKES